VTAAAAPPATCAILPPIPACSHVRGRQNQAVPNNRGHRKPLTLNSPYPSSGASDSEFVPCTSRTGCRQASRVILRNEGSPRLNGQRGGSFDSVRKLAALRMTIGDCVFQNRADHQALRLTVRSESAHGGGAG